VDTALSKITQLETVAKTAVVIYPILLPDRIELLVSLPNGLSEFWFRWERRRSRKRCGNFAAGWKKRTTREYLPHAQKLYDWLIRPLEADLPLLTSIPWYSYRTGRFERFRWPLFTTGNNFW